MGRKSNFFKSVSLGILMRVPHSEEGLRPSWPWRLGRIRDRLMRLASDGPTPGTQPASTGEVPCTSTIRAGEGKGSSLNSDSLALSRLHQAFTYLSPRHGALTNGRYQ